MSECIHKYKCKRMLRCVLIGTFSDFGFLANHRICSEASQEKCNAAEGDPALMLSSLLICVKVLAVLF